jgi:hypothetical protein
MARGRRQKVGTYRTCCRSIVKHVDESIKIENNNRKLSFGTHLCTKRLGFYTGLSSSTLHKLLRTDDVLPENESKAID